MRSNEVSFPMTTNARLMGLVLVLFFSLSAGFVFGEGSPVVVPASPSKELSIRLLALRDERFTKDYEVALIMPGEAKFQGLVVANAAKVTFFGLVIEEGKKRRALDTELFLWNKEYGWFLCEFGERLGRTTVFIWSELRGEVEIN